MLILHILSPLISCLAVGGWGLATIAVVAERRPRSWVSVLGLSVAVIMMAASVLFAAGWGIDLGQARMGDRAALYRLTGR